MNLKISDKLFPLSKLSIYYTWKNINLNYQLRHGMKSLTYLIDLILYQIFKITLNMSYKNETVTDNPSIMIYVNKIENRITFRIKTRYYLLILEAIKLRRSTKSKINKDKKGENVSHLEINEVVLMHCNIVNNNFQQG